MALYEPRRPTLAALGLNTVWIAVLSLPMWAGKFLAQAPWSDQASTGYAFRAWAAHQWHATGHIPLWNPEIFGGMPFVAAMHGDIFYPTAWLRLVLPTWLAMDLGFVVHYVLAGFFLYLLLRQFGVSWAGSVVGGLGYQLSGVVASLVSPGHDGKLFVSALFPLALLLLHVGFKKDRWEAFGLLAVVVGLAALSPHPQMLYYMLLACGLFALYLAFGTGGPQPVKPALAKLGLALAAVMVGFGIGMIQFLPFFAYIPFSPRAESYYGFEQAASFAIPWAHLPEFFLARFTGMSQNNTYWGPNYPIKLHSEYLGLPIVALAVLGALDRGRRRLVWWLGGIGLLFMLVALGSSTPFYRLWWSVMPFMKKVRAPGMAFYIVSFVVCVFAAFGVERLERGEGKRWGAWAMGIGAAIALLAAAGTFGGLAVSLADYRVADIARGAAGPIRLGALLSGAALVAAGVVVWMYHRGAIKPMGFALALMAVTSGDLWRNAQAFWLWSDTTLYAGDPITRRLEAEPLPLRVMNLAGFEGAEAYPGALLMAHDIPQVLGHHGFELHRFDELLGGRNQWRYLAASPRPWALYALNWVVLPTGSQLESQLPGMAEGYDSVMTSVTTADGTKADLYHRTTPYPYARLVPVALKAPDEQAIPTMVDPRTRFDVNRIVLLAPDALVPDRAFTGLPDPLQSTVSVQSWRPGHMELAIEPAAPQDAYVVVSENWYKNWHATVDGAPAQVLRGDVSLLTVPVPQGASRVELTFQSPEYAKGKAIMLVSLVLALGWVVGPAVVRRRGRG